MPFLLKMKPLLTSVVLLFLSFSAFAQQATLKGKMISSNDNSALPFANVKIENAAGDITGATSDFDGLYEAKLDAGTYKVTFIYVGFTELTKEVTLAAGEERVLDITLGNTAELLEQVIVTTNKSETKIGKSTVSVAVIQPDLIDNTNSTAIDQVVDKVPGVNIIDGQANIRGGSGYSYGAGSRVLLLVDDLPFLAGDAGFPNWRDVPVENINQIEVVKGAASALYGSSALNGIINVRTAYPTSEPLTKVSAFGTMYYAPPTLDTCSSGDCPGVEPVRRDWWNDSTNTQVGTPFDAGMQFAHRQKFGRFDLVLGANLYANNSFRQGEYDRKFRFNTNTRYRITDKLSVGVNFNFNVGNSRSFFVWSDPWTQANIPFEDFTTPTKALRYNIDPFVTYFDNYGNRHKLLTRFYHVGNDNGNNQSNFSNLMYGEYQFQRKFEQLDDLGIVAGTVGQYTKVDAQLYGNAQYSQSNVGIYLQADKGFFKDEETGDYKLSLSGGMRYEFNSVSSPDSVLTCGPSVGFSTPFVTTHNPSPKQSDSRPVFRLGANYQPAEYTYIRASWGQGYRFPTIAEKFITTNIASLLSICPNPGLQSETGYSAEIGIKQGFKVSSWQGFLDLSGFFTEYQDMMEFTFGGADFTDQIIGFQSVNIGDTRISGADISLMGQGELFGFPTTVITGYTYISPKFVDWDTTTITDVNTATPGQINAELTTGDENFLKYRMQHTFKFDGQTTFFDKLDVGFSLQYNSFMKTVDQFFEKQRVQVGSVITELDLFNLEEYRARYRKGQAVIDIRMAYRFNENLKLSMIMKNVGNNEYSIRPALMGAPRNITVRFDAKF